MNAPVCMWSGPRNLSTAMMRSFGAREDCEVWDEPFFAPFLYVTGQDHPGRAETLERHETNEEVVAIKCGEYVPRGVGKRFSFQKHMAHHMIPAFPRHWIDKGKHFFLIREPERVIASYVKGRAKFDLDDLGYKPMRCLYDEISAITSSPPPIIDSLDILKDPETALKKLCQAIDIPFDPAMLSWEAGPRPEDGAWAPYWYASVENSTGFAPPPTEKPQTPKQYRNILDACLADFEALFERRLRV